MLVVNLPVNFKMLMIVDSKEIDEKIRHLILDQLESTLL